MAYLDPKGEGDKSMPANPAAGSSGQGRRAGGTRVIWRNCAARRSVVFPM
jgi:hypothetical protein